MLSGSRDKEKDALAEKERGRPRGLPGTASTGRMTGGRGGRAAEAGGKGSGGLRGQRAPGGTGDGGTTGGQGGGTPLARDLRANLIFFRETFRDCSDVVFRELSLGEERRRAAIIYVDGLEDKTPAVIIQKALMVDSRAAGEPPGVLPGGDPLQELHDRLLPLAEVLRVHTREEALREVLEGNLLLLLHGSPQALALDAKAYHGRPVTEPETEGAIRGPKESFVENLRLNTALLRRRLQTPTLKIVTRRIGRYSQTQVAVAYLESLADPAVVAEVQRRLARIDLDGLLDSGYVEELIEDNPYSPFPQVANTERPDKLAAALLEGRVGILVDGSPFALIVPTVFAQFLQAAEDYYERYPLASFLRLGRLIGLNAALLLPALYIAATTFHQEMFPSRLLLTIAAQREGVPFPALLEALVMELIFEMLREAGLRLPQRAGQAISIVGALIIGQGAVQAGVVSGAMVVVVAATAIANFSLPAFNMAVSIRLLRFPMMLLAGTLGFYGIMLGLIALLIHLCSLRSFGVPYLSPVAPLTPADLQDVVVRAPRWALGRRPRLTGYRNPRRQRSGLRPGAGRREEEGAGGEVGPDHGRA